MLCKELMKKEAESVHPEDTVQDAARRMKDENVGFLPVCDAKGKVIGTITDRDITTRVVADGKPGKTPVRDVSSHEVVACAPEADLEEAMKLMRAKKKSRIIVSDRDGRLLGVISLSDLAQVAGDASTKTLRDVSERESSYTS